jgi:L-gulonate 3-dehydrogenase
MDSAQRVHYNDQRHAHGSSVIALAVFFVFCMHFLWTGFMASSVAIVGAGLVGRAWAMVFARAGWTVKVFDSHPAQRAAAQRHIASDLEEQASFGLVADAAAAAARITWCDELRDAIHNAEWVQESSPEDVDVKRELFAALDAGSPRDAILASSTSAIPASRFTESLPGRARCLVAHPVNPPHLVPLVELCGAPWTAPAVIERAQDVMSAIGQVPVVVRRELDGFVLNRLQGALLSEAMRLVGEGYITAPDLDKTVSEGLGLRWSFMGPLATIELNAPGGIKDYCARYGGFYRRLASDPPAPAVWDDANAQKVGAAIGAAPTPAALDAKTAWRNSRLLALRRHKLEQAAQ